MIEKIIKPIIEYDTTFHHLYLHKDISFIEDGKQIGGVNSDTCTCAPGEIEKAKAYFDITDTDPLLVFLNAMWTQEVIEEYNRRIIEQENRVI